DDWWREHWRGMPEFVQEDLRPRRTIEVRFRTERDVRAFEKLIGGPIYHGKWTWYPHQEYRSWSRTAHWAGGEAPRYPIYVPSKGRWATPFTIRTLQRCGLPFRVVVEPQEAEAYARVV